MRVKVNIDCSPEEARRFMGLPDVTPVNERYVAMMTDAVSGASSIEQVEKMMKDFAPFGDMGMKMFKQFSALAGDAAKAGAKNTGPAKD
ncbi:DUF6489 family protein [Flavisphingopyxis soli]|uniref:DUF6489 family protein n=1 Tax=Flavisphingopyxis soli TaxID=2601267 RepID=UPI00191C3373|nr:DUF6489 family protein [Sphingorhabdus soli]